MGQWLTTWGNLLLTAVLVGITAWYAYLTKRLSKSATESADSARIAAEATQRSVAATMAGVNVHFAISPRYGFEFALSDIEEDDSEDDEGLGERLSGVDVRALGATLFVHWCDLMSTSYPTGDGEADEYLMGVKLRPDAGHAVRMHKGETHAFVVPVETEMPSGWVCDLSVKVWYSLTDDGPVEPVWVEWHGRKGVDY